MNSVYSDSQGRNALHALAARGQTRLVTKTISAASKGVLIQSLTARDVHGSTPLHIAAYCGHLRVLRAFYDACPEAMDVRNADGDSVWDSLWRSSFADIETHNFDRSVWIEPVGMHYDEFKSSYDVLDFALSSNSAVAVVSNSFNQSKRVYASIGKDARFFDLKDVNFVATSNAHSLAISNDKCYVWGKNAHGELGLQNEKLAEPTMLPFRFAEYASSGANAFSALENASIREPLVGAACGDGYSCVYTSHVLYAWGANRGQMRDINEEISAPHTVYTSNSSLIKSVHACENMIVVLHESGTLLTLCAGKTQQCEFTDIESVKACGAFIVTLTTRGKLLRMKVNTKLGIIDKPSTVWVPRKPKDTVSSYDVAESGSLVIATRANVYKLVDKQLTELKFLRGVSFSALKTDQYFRRFWGVQKITAALEYVGFQKPMPTAANQLPSKCTVSPFLEYIDWTSEKDCTLITDFHPVKVHSALLFAACAALRPLILGKQRLVAVPGGSTVFKLDSNVIKVENSYFDAIDAFINWLYGVETELVGPARHELHALQTLITKNAGQGLWKARLGGVGCDTAIENGLNVHSSVLKSVSPVFKAQLTRWSPTELQEKLFPSPETRERVLQFVYTHSLTGISFSSERVSQIYELFELWQTADALLIPDLYTACEHRIFETVDFSTALLFLKLCELHGTTKSRFYGGVLRLVAYSMPYFVTMLNELSTELNENIEKVFQQLPGTRKPDQDLADAFESLRTLSLERKPELQQEKRRQSSSSLNTKPRFEEKPVVENAIKEDEDEDEGGWVQMRKKTRTKSQHAQEQILIRAPLKASPSSSIPSSSSTPLVSPAVTPARTEVKVSPLASLPTLGAKQTKPKASPRRKQGGKQEVLRIDDPVLLAQQLVHEPPAASPWRTVPRAKK